MKISSLLLYLLPTLALGGLPGGYNYDRCDGEFGPSSWPGQCQLQSMGSPIDLCGAETLPKSEPPLFSGLRSAVQPRPVVTRYDIARPMDVYNNGASVGLVIPDDPDAPKPPQLTIFALANLTGRSSRRFYEIWLLHSVEVHWGRKERYDEGSEHLLNGKRYAAEIHLVHYNKKYDNFSYAVSSGGSDALLAVAVLLDVPPLINVELNLGLEGLKLNALGLVGLNLGSSPSEPDLVKIIADAVETATETPERLEVDVSFSDLFNAKDDFYSYGGSLTTPVCSETVTWIVMKNPKRISRTSLQKFWEASTTPGQPGGELISQYGNYRPLQPIGDRTVYYTGDNDASCGSPTDPLFVC